MGLVQVGGSHLHQHVLGLQGDLGEVTVDDGGQTHHFVLMVQEHREHLLSSDVLQVGLEFLVGRIDLHELMSVHLLFLVQGHEQDILRLASTITEGSLSGI